MGFAAPEPDLIADTPSVLTFPHLTASDNRSAQRLLPPQPAWTTNTMKHEPSEDITRRAWHFQTRRAQAKQRTYEQLVEAGRQLFEEHGYEATTVRDVAQAVGMSTGAVFANFTDKAALFIDVINADCEKLSHKMGAADISGCTAVEALERMLTLAQEHHTDQLGLVQAAISFVWRSDISPERRNLHGVRLIKQRLLAILRRGVETGELTFPVDVSLMTDMIVDSYLASLRRMVFDGVRKADLQTLQIKQIQVLLAAYASKAA
jgi:AcrR family transcriptional regulator